jgi:hypothetical protein
LNHASSLTNTLAVWSKALRQRSNPLPRVVVEARYVAPSDDDGVAPWSGKSYLSFGRAAAAVPPFATQLSRLPTA